MANEQPTTMEAAELFWSADSLDQPALSARFNRKWRRNPATGCHEWTAAMLPNGYGAIQFKGKKSGAHRVAWVLYYGKIPHGMCVCHKCDNRRCVNPNHLFLGTHRDNVLDMHAKGRNADRRGQNNPARKLSPAEICKVVSAYLDGGQTLQEIADEFHISVTTIRNLAGSSRRGRAGSRNGRAKLTKSLAGQIRQMHWQGRSLLSISQEVGLSWPTVKRVVSGESFV